jgi:hypothetical protein
MELSAVSAYAGGVHRSFVAKTTVPQDDKCVLQSNGAREMLAARLRLRRTAEAAVPIRA